MTGSVLALGVNLYGCSDLDIIDTDIINDDISLALAVVLPVLFTGALPEDKQQRQKRIEETIVGMRRAIKRLPPHTLDELNDLFNLLTNRVTNLIYAGSFAATESLTPKQVTAMIESWRTNYVSLLNQAYEGLKELSYAAFYGNEKNWQHLNYQKPNIGI